MAAKLVELYEQTTREFGTAGRVKLAMLTKVSSAKASEAPDTPDAVRTFEQAIERMRAEAR